MSSFYYLHIWTSGDTDVETKVVDNNVHPIKLANVGLEFQDWYKDDLFRTFPVFVCTDRLKSRL